MALPTQNIPQEGQLFIQSSDAQSGDIAQLYRIQGGQVQVFNPTDILTAEEKSSAGSVGAQRNMAIDRLKAQGINPSALPQVQFPYELGMPIVGGNSASLFGGTSTPAIAPAANSSTPTTPFNYADELAKITAPLGSQERTNQLLTLGQRLLGTGTPPAGTPPIPPTIPPPLPVPPTPTNNPITSVSSLQQNQQINALETKIKDQSAEIKAGIASGGATKILEGLFEKFGVAKETSLLNDYNAMILEKQQLLRKIPEDIKNTLQDVGVSQAQLDRLILKETQKPTEVLRDLMEQKGAVQDRINQSLKFVELFSNAELKDQAAKIEAMKFDFETNKDLLSRLDKRQQEFLKIALNDKKATLTLQEKLLQGGAPKTLVNENLTDEQLLAKYGNFLVKPDTSPSVIGSAETGYLQYNPVTGKFDIPIKAPGGGGNKPLSILDVQRYNEFSPEAGVTAGDTEASANAKVAKVGKSPDLVGITFNGLTATLKDGSQLRFPNQEQLNQFKKDNNLTTPTSSPTPTPTSTPTKTNSLTPTSPTFQYQSPDLSGIKNWFNKLF